MKDNAVKPHETDISGVVLMVAILMIGVAFVLFSNKLISKPTSTTTRAFENRGVDCKTTNPLGLDGAMDLDGYDTSGDSCRFICVNGDTKVGSCNPILGATCCRSADQTTKIGDARCARMNSDQSAKCKESCDINSGESQLNGTCGYTSSLSGLKEGVCCGNPNPPTSAPIPTPTGIPVVINNNDCGSYHIDCDTKNTGKICLSNGGTKGWCGYKVAGKQMCSGLKVVYPVLDKTGTKLTTKCMKEIKELASNAGGTNDYYCSMTLINVATTMKDARGASVVTTENQRLNECKTTAAPIGHLND